MYTIWMLALFLGAVSADVGLTGYHYKVPETKYGVPSYQIGTSGYKPNFSGSASGTGTTGGGIGFSQSPNYSAGSSNIGYAGSTNSAYATTGTGTGFNYGTTHGSSGGSSFNYNTHGSGSGQNFNGLGTSSTNQANQGAYFGSIGQNTQPNLNGYYQTGGASVVGSKPSQFSGSSYYNQHQSSNEYQSSIANKYQEYYNQIIQQPPQIFKHFYVHAAPEEPEVPKPRQALVLPPPQKHYKFIFIKAPVQHAPAPQLIPVPQQNEEKTIVYVLSKKPEETQNIVLPKIEQKPPTKPEVFFIKYNDKQDSQAVINNIVNDYNKGGVTTSFSSIGTGFPAGVHSSSLASSSGVIGDVESTSGFGSTTSGSGFGSTTGFGSETSAGVSDGSYSVSSASAENAYGVSSAAENHVSGSIETQYTSGGPTVVTPSVDINSFSSGLESIFGTPGSIVSTSTASSESVGFDASAISTSQGVPHETYGVPKFKQY